MKYFSIFFLIIASTCYSVRIKVEDFSRLLDRQEFKKLKETHNESEMDHHFSAKRRQETNSNRTIVELNSSFYYRPDNGHDGVNRIRVFGGGLYYSFVCVLSNVLHLAHNVNFETQAIADNKCQAIEMAKRIQKSASRWLSWSKKDYIDNISCRTFHTNKLLCMGDEIKQIMADHTDAILIIVSQSDKDKAFLDNSIDTTQYPAERVKFFKSTCPDKVTELTVDIDKRTIQETEWIPYKPYKGETLKQHASHNF